MEKFSKIEDRTPPVSPQTGPLGWVIKNMFSSKFNGGISIVSFIVLIYIAPYLINWLFLDATWTGENRDACLKNSGACWLYIREKFDLFMYGFYPKESYWRVNLVGILFFVFIAPLFFKNFKYKVKWGLTALVAYPFVAFLFFYGGILGLEVVATNKWGGLMLTLFVAYIGIIAAFPIGVILALGRTSNLPVARYLSIVFIEFWRGVPLITILFMASVVLPLFLPEGADLDKLMRALVGITLFQSAYLAEVVRGGIQAIPKGQYEAADSLGLTYYQKISTIVLPQALRIVIPSLVGSSISLLKDTTLLLIIGLFDVLTMVIATSADQYWLGFEPEGYVFVGFIFWIFCYALSRYSFFLEKKTAYKKES